MMKIIFQVMDAPPTAKYKSVATAGSMQMKNAMTATLINMMAAQTAKLSTVVMAFSIPQKNVMMEQILMEMVAAAYA